MSAPFFSSPRSAPRFGLTATLFLLVICVNMRCFPGNVAWLPDSTGIVFSSSSGRQVERYDWTKKETQVLLPDREAQHCTPWFTLRPDGQRLALVRLVAKATATMSAEESLKPPGSLLQVYVYDLSGQLVQQTPLFDWPGEVRGNQPAPTAALWAPRQSKLLLYGQGYTGICDLSKNQMTLVGRYLPFGLSPIQPSGNGFVAQNLDEKADDPLVFVDWQGGKKAFKVPAKKELEGKQLAGPYRWEGDTLLVEFEDDLARLDTVRLEAKIVPKPAQDTPPEVGQDPLILHVFIKTGKTLLRRKSKDAPGRVEVILLPATPPQVLAEMASVQDSAFVSPDGNLVALRGEPVKPQTDKTSDSLVEQILIINSAGELLAKVNVPE